MRIEVVNARNVSHMDADKIRIKDGTRIITIDLLAGDVMISTADSEDSKKALVFQPVHTNKIKVL